MLVRDVAWPVGAPAVVAAAPVPRPGRRVIVPGEVVAAAEAVVEVEEVVEEVAAEAVAEVDVFVGIDIVSKVTVMEI